MPVKIKGEKYYRTSEAAQIAGISRSTLLRWIEDGVFKDESRREQARLATFHANRHQPAPGRSGQGEIGTTTAQECPHDLT